MNEPDSPPAAKDAYVGIFRPETPVVAAAPAATTDDNSIRLEGFTPDQQQAIDGFTAKFNEKFSFIPMRAGVTRKDGKPAFAILLPKTFQRAHLSEIGFAGTNFDRYDIPGKWTVPTEIMATVFPAGTQLIDTEIQQGIRNANLKELEQVTVEATDSGFILRNVVSGTDPAILFGEENGRKIVSAPDSAVIIPELAMNMALKKNSLRLSRP